MGSAVCYSILYTIYISICAQTANQISYKAYSRIPLYVMSIVLVYTFQPRLIWRRRICFHYLHILHYLEIETIYLSYIYLILLRDLELIYLSIFMIYLSIYLSIYLIGLIEAIYLTCIVVIHLNALT